ncbi:hypothetical protein BT67DRAFT_445018 [Trichocladium antarcticum]|uniref:Uncharacterized protein n=1 Tax=Trichocladium antarcticum TaxID=1450529 RepID=A0AAN6UDJ0_9PEZI|nr:hypothetical protein BT67DRAFT_445018 [Trichocladium antarcticum]
MGGGVGSLGLFYLVLMVLVCVLCGLGWFGLGNAYVRLSPRSFGLGSQMYQSLDRFTQAERGDGFRLGSLSRCGCAPYCFLFPVTSPAQGRIS